MMSMDVLWVVLLPRMPVTTRIFIFLVGDPNKHATVTPLKTNMSPENRWLEDVFPTEMVTL